MGFALDWDGFWVCAGFPLRPSILTLWSCDQSKHGMVLHGCSRQPLNWVPSLGKANSSSEDAKLCLQQQGSPTFKPHMQPCVSIIDGDDNGGQGVCLPTLTQGFARMRYQPDIRHPKKACIARTLLSRSPNYFSCRHRCPEEHNTHTNVHNGEKKKKGPENALRVVFVPPMCRLTPLEKTCPCNPKNSSSAAAVKANVLQLTFEPRVQSVKVSRKIPCHVTEQWWETLSRRDRSPYPRRTPPSLYQVVSS